MNYRNKRAAEGMKPDETCRCQIWKGFFTSIPKTRKPVPRNDNHSTSALVRLRQAFGEEFGTLENELATSVRAFKLMYDESKEMSHSNPVTLKEGIDSTSPGCTRNGDVGILLDKRQHYHGVEWEHSASRADKQVSPKPGPSSSAIDSRAPTTEQAARDSCPRYVVQEQSATGEKLCSYQSMLTPIQEEGTMPKPSKGKRIRKYGSRLHKFLEDGMKLVEKELLELTLDSQHQGPKSEPVISRPQDRTSKRGTANDCAEEKLKGTDSFPCPTFADHEVLLAQQKVRELRLQPSCTNSSEFASSPQVDSSQIPSAGWSRECAIEDLEEFDKQVGERQLEELLVVQCSRAFKKEPCQMQTEAPSCKMLVGGSEHCTAESSDNPPLSSEVEKKPYHVGTKLKGYIAEPSIFHEAIQEYKVTIHHFCTLLVARREMLRVLLSKYGESGVRIATPDDRLFFIEGLLNATAFLDFDREDFGLDDEDSVFSKPASRQISFIEDFNAPNSTSSLLFEAKKIELVAKEIDYPTHSWPAALKTVFSSAMMSVWRAHKLAFAFEPPVTMFQLGNRLQFDETYMEPHTQTAKELLLSQPPFLSTAEFMVTPGFHVQGRLVVKSQVYCIGG